MVIFHMILHGCVENYGSQSAFNKRKAAHDEAAQD